MKQTKLRTQNALISNNNISFPVGTGLGH
jgi:hypothetical protein